ncbi:hypothetical protein FAF44_41805 [Nonomuraea sp. MG754425]|uniref:hypothetical protein n=1 Tax=Nonomuraea sp. MG754425 TaxID=2570319 RepID=UPI001F3ADC96|nr:hypothetical protein [Nonomuraea sp. MG754425]MCF6474867.1 hypothetical protein [Nonomuraea sp. MG754425]
MAGAIGVSDTITWHTNGWGYRRLIGEAARLAPPEHRDLLEQYQVQPGLTLPLLPEAARLPIASLLVRAARDLIATYENGDDEYERGYAHRLRNLIALLGDEITHLQQETEQ